MESYTKLRDARHGIVEFAYRDSGTEASNSNPPLLDYTELKLKEVQEQAILVQLGAVNCLMFPSLKSMDSSSELAPTPSVRSRPEYTKSATNSEVILSFVEATERQVLLFNNLAWTRVKWFRFISLDLLVIALKSRGQMENMSQHR